MAANASRHFVVLFLIWWMEVATDGEDIDQLDTLEEDARRTERRKLQASYTEFERHRIASIATDILAEQTSQWQTKRLSLLAQNRAVAAEIAAKRQTVKLPVIPKLASDVVVPVAQPLPTGWCWTSLGATPYLGADSDSNLKFIPWLSEDGDINKSSAMIRLPLYFNTYGALDYDVNQLGRDPLKAATLVATVRAVSPQPAHPGEKVDVRDVEAKRELVFSTLAALWDITPFQLEHAYQELSLDTIVSESEEKLRNPADEADLMETHWALFCRRCYIFHCQIHGTRALRPRLPEGFSHSTSHKEILPCTPDCYRLHTHAISSSIPTVTWNAVEEMLYRRASAIFSEDPCMIARIITSRPCREVYERMTIDFNLPAGGSVYTPERPLRRKQSNKVKKWNYTDLSAVGVYVPCRCEGECILSSNDDANKGRGKTKRTETPCKCVRSKNYCEKYCLCSLRCANKFPGCQCTTRCTSDTCVCRSRDRECDPDICQCGSIHTDCGNVGLTLGQHKWILIGRSLIVGWGVFAGEPINEGELLGEYVGEYISDAEANRRGDICDAQRKSYLFNLTVQYALDAARFGNKTRFMNHADDSEPHCNAVALTKVVKGDRRVGVYARRYIPPGEEILFDYHYQQQFRELVGKSKNTKH